MKKIVLLLFSASLLIACSNDDSDNNGPATGAIYLPLTAGNFWTYDVDGTTVSGRDSLYVANDTVISGETYKRMQTQFIPFGFYSGSLKNNGARYSNGSVIVSGNANFYLGETFPIELALSNFTILKENATDGQQLSSVDGTIEQVYQGYPLNIDYALTSTAQQTLPSYTSPDGTTYTDVKQVKLTMNLAISTTIDFGFPIDVPILQSQDVVVSTMYFAKDIGMVYASTVLSYNLEDFSAAGVELPIPSSGSETQQEFLDVYVAE